MRPQRSPYTTESVLIDQLVQRDEQAFRWLYRHYATSLHLLLLKSVRDREQADDLLQDVFIKIWQRIDHYDGRRGRLYTWMRNIAQHTAVDAHRASQAQKRLTANHMLPLTNETTYLVDQVRWVLPRNPDHIGLRDQLDSLSPHQRQLLELIYFEGFTQQEVADQLAIPIGTVKTRLRVAVQALKGLF